MATMQQQQEQQALDAVIQMAHVLQADRCCQVAAVVIALYDYALSFDKEIRYIWGRRFSPVTFFYLVNRYMGNMVIICDAILLTNTSFSVDICKIFQLVAVFGPFVSIWSTQMIMQLRLYVMYSNSKKILAFTLTLLTLEVAGTVVVIVMWMRTITYTNLPFAPAEVYSWHMCATSSPGRSLTAIYVPIFAYEMVMFGLALFAVFRKLGGIGGTGVGLRRQSKMTKLQATVNMLFKYSIIYFTVYLVACAVAIGMYLGLAPTYIDLLNAFLVVASVLLGSHMVLGARDFNPAPEVDLDTSDICRRTVGSGQISKPLVSHSIEMTSITRTPVFEPTTSFASFSSSAYALGMVYSPTASLYSQPFRPSQFPTSSASCSSVAQSPSRHAVERDRDRSPLSSVVTMYDDCSDVVAPNYATRF